MTTTPDVGAGGRSFVAMNYTAASTSMPVTIPPSAPHERKQRNHAAQANLSLRTSPEAQVISPSDAVAAWSSVGYGGRMLNALR